MNLLSVEMRRALRRRSVRVLIATALLGCVVAGVIAFAGSAGKTLLELTLDDEGSPAVLTDWWIASDDEGGFLAIAMFSLFLGGFIGGATLAGGEWRAGTVTTILTWEPRRGRVHAARTGAAALLAGMISFVLQALFLASFLPAVFVNGTTAGADAGFWGDLLIVMARTSVITAAAAALGVALATAARNTAFAIISAFVWLTVIEGLVRGLKPSAAQWLWGENIGTVMIWGQLPDADLAHEPIVAFATLSTYSIIIIAVAAVSFMRRDIAAAT
jgi:hypothetical protein